jgi:hypothetical protein
MLQKAFGSKRFVKHLTARIKNFVSLFTGKNVFKLQTFLHCFCYVNASYQNVKKVSKSVKITRQFPVYTKRTKMIVNP